MHGIYVEGANIADSILYGYFLVPESAGFLIFGY